MKTKNELIPVLPKLAAIAKDRGKLAHLKKGWSLQRTRALPTLAQVGFPILSQQEQETYETIGCVFATHPSNTNKGSIGSTLQQIVGPGRNPDKSPQTKRLQRFLHCETREDVALLSITLAKMAKAKNVPINIEQLAQDIFYWKPNGENLSIKRRWAHDFYNTTN